jgi:hypothetical protein
MSTHGRDLWSWSTSAHLSSTWLRQRPSTAPARVLVAARAALPGRGHVVQRTGPLFNDRLEAFLNRTTASWPGGATRGPAGHSRRAPHPGASHLATGDRPRRGRCVHDGAAHSPGLRHRRSDAARRVAPLRGPWPAPRGPAARRLPPLIAEGKGGQQRIIPLLKRFFATIANYLGVERPSTSSSDHVFVVLKGPRRGLRVSGCSLARSRINSGPSAMSRVTVAADGSVRRRSRGESAWRRVARRCRGSCSS